MVYYYQVFIAAAPPAGYIIHGHGKSLHGLISARRTMNTGNSIQWSENWWEGDGANILALD